MESVPRRCPANNKKEVLSMDHMSFGLVCGIVGGLMVIPIMALMPKKKCVKCGKNIMKFANRCPSCKTLQD
jgi:hypothetical protein